MSRQFNFIKVEPVRTNYNFYEKGDLVFAKCKNSPPWPAVINEFKGFDEDDVQVFTVDFMGTHDYAYMESYLLTPVSQKKIKKMKATFQQQNPCLYKALVKAEIELASIKQFSQLKTQFIERYINLYESENNTDGRVLVDADQPLPANKKIRNTIELLAKQKQNCVIQPCYKIQTRASKRSRLTLWHDSKLTIQISTVMKQQKQIMTKIIVDDLVWIRYQKFIAANIKVKVIYQQVNKIQKLMTSNFLKTKKCLKRQKNIVNVINYTSVQIAMHS